jgi:Tol biopolymer transport system component
MTPQAPIASRRQRFARIAPLAALVFAGMSLAFAPAPTEAAFAGTNGRIVFVSNQTTPNNPEGDNEVFTMKADGSGIKQLTKNAAEDFDAVVSKDGARLAFVSNRDGDDEIFVMNVDGSGVVQLTKNSVPDEDPSWAPSKAGTGRLVISSERDGNPEIYAIDGDDGGNALRVTNNPAPDVDPAWSPDGAKIAFVSNRTGNLEIFVTDIAGVNATNVTNKAATDYAPAWSPDSKRLAFATNRDGDAEVYTMTATGGSPTNRSRDLGKDEEPVWSPDGKQIAFMRADADGYYDVWTMRANGAAQIQLTKNGAAYDYASDWLGRSR